MKRLLYISACILLLFPGITKTGIIIWFKANQEFISETLCINRDNIGLNCRGCCVLNTKLKQVDESEKTGNKNIPSQLSEKEWPLFVGVADEQPSLLSSSVLLFHIISPHLQSQCTEEIFHPPSLV